MARVQRKNTLGSKLIYDQCAGLFVVGGHGKGVPGRTFSKGFIYFLVGKTKRLSFSRNRSSHKEKYHTQNKDKYLTQKITLPGAIVATPKISNMNTLPPSRVDFSKLVGPKRRRMRSGGNVSTLSNNALPKEVMSSSKDDETTVQTSKCKGTTTIPIFLKSM